MGLLESISRSATNMLFNGAVVVRRETRAILGAISLIGGPGGGVLRGVRAPSSRDVGRFSKLTANASKC